MILPPTQFDFTRLLDFISQMPVEVEYIRIHECYLNQFLDLPSYPHRVVFDPDAPSPVTIMFYGAPRGTE